MASANHQASACSAARIRTPSLGGVHADRRAAANERVWAWITDDEKLAVHRVFCRRSPLLGDAKRIRNVVNQLCAEAGTYTVKDLLEEFNLPVRVNDDPKHLAELRKHLCLDLLPNPLQPTSVEEVDAVANHHIKVVSRVCDDDREPPPYAELALRRRIDECSHCQYPCWTDDQSTINAATQILLCLACTRMDYINKLRAKGQW